MRIRISFRSDIYIEGETLKEIRDKFETMPLYSAEALDDFVEFSELHLVEDADTNEDLMLKWNNCYDPE